MRKHNNCAISIIINQGMKCKLILIYNYINNKTFSTFDANFLCIFGHHTSKISVNANMLIFSNAQISLYSLAFATKNIYTVRSMCLCTCALCAMYI